MMGNREVSPILRTIPLRDLWRGGGLLSRARVGYGTLFVIAGIFHVIGFLAVLIAWGKLHPLKAPELTSIESE